MKRRNLAGTGTAIMPSDIKHRHKTPTDQLGHSVVVTGSPQMQHPNQNLICVALVCCVTYMQ